MKEYKEVTETTPRTFQKLISITCDFCGAVAKTQPTWDDYTNFERSDVEIATKVMQKEGSYYPEAGWEITRAVDMCPTCFEKKLVPWIEGQGVKFQETKTKW